MKRALVRLWLIIIVVGICSCGGDSGGKSRSEQSGEAIRSSVSEAAVLTQAMKYVYMSCMSNGYTTALYATSLTDETLGNACFELMFSIAAEIGELGDLDLALDALGVIEPSASSQKVFIILKGWDFYQALKSSTSDVRHRFLQIVDQLSPATRSEVYGEVFNHKLSEAEKARCSTEAEFYSRAEAGKLDYAMPQIHNLCYNFVPEYGAVTLSFKGRPIDIFVSKGTELVEKGAKFNNSANMAVLSAPLKNIINEKIDFKQTATNYLNMVQNTTGALQAGQTVVDYIQTRLPQVAPELPNAASTAQAVTSVVDDLTIQSLMETNDPPMVTEELLNLGYSQIKVQIPGKADASPDENLVVVTDDTLFSGARVRISSADAANGPIIVEPGIYNVSASVGGKVQNVGDVAAPSGQAVNVPMTPEDWKEITKHFGFSDIIDGDEDTAVDGDADLGACSGSCVDGTDEKYCIDNAVCVCLVNEWTLKECDWLCDFYSLGPNLGCYAHDEAGETCQCLYDHCWKPSDAAPCPLETHEIIGSGLTEKCCPRIQ